MILRAKTRRSLVGATFVAPALIFVLVMLVYPLVYSLYLSFTEYDVLYDQAPRFVGIANYVTAFSDRLFLNSIKVTFVFAAASFVFGVGVPLVLSLLLHAVGRRSTIHEVALFLPIVVPVSLGCLVFYILLEPGLGYLSYFLREVVGGQPFAWTAAGPSALITLILVSQWQLGYQVVILLAALRNVNQELLDAATIDGASSLQRTLFVVLPQIRHSIAVVSIVAVIRGFKTFVQPMVMTLGGPNHATETMYFRLYRTGFELHQMGYASTMAYILSAIIIIFSLANLKMFGGER